LVEVEVQNYNLQNISDEFSQLIFQRQSAEILLPKYLLLTLKSVSMII